MKLPHTKHSAEHWITSRAQVTADSLFERINKGMAPPFRMIVPAPPEYVSLKRDELARRLGEETLIWFNTERTPDFIFDPEASQRATDEFPAINTAVGALERPEGIVLVFSPQETA